MFLLHAAYSRMGLVRQAQPGPQFATDIPEPRRSGRHRYQ
jgi:hypothetical protein